MVDVDCNLSVDSGLSCCWPLSIDEDCCEGIEDESPDRVNQIGQIVSAMMTRWSGYQIGLCQTQIRPLSECTYCRTWCCGGADGILLEGPNGLRVADVLAVYSPDELPLDEWRFEPSNQTLYRVPPDKWPTRDAKYLEVGEDGTFGVDIVVGSPPDAWAMWVAEQMFCELIKACRGGKCRIPKNAVSVVGQGVTISLSDDELKHLLPEVSAWASAVNPARAVVPPRAMSPEVARRGARSTGALRGVRGCCG